MMSREHLKPSISRKSQIWTLNIGSILHWLAKRRLSQCPATNCLWQFCYIRCCDCATPIHSVKHQTVRDLRRPRFRGGKGSLHWEFLRTYWIRDSLNIHYCESTPRWSMKT